MTNIYPHTCTREQFARDCHWFTLEELTASQYKQAAINAGHDPEPNEEQIECLRQLVVHVLDPLRELWKGPIWVNSGYRCPFVNGAAKGVKGSQHMKGQAADISIRLPNTKKPDYMANLRLLGLIFYEHLPYDQVLAEGCNKFGMPAWIHISYVNKAVNRQFNKQFFA